MRLRSSSLASAGTLDRAIGQRVWEIGIEQIIKLDRTPKNGPGDEPGPQ